MKKICYRVSDIAPWLFRYFCQWVENVFLVRTSYTGKHVSYRVYIDWTDLRRLFKAVCRPCQERSTIKNQILYLQQINEYLSCEHSKRQDRASRGQSLLIVFGSRYVSLLYKFTLQMCVRWYRIIRWLRHASFANVFMLFFLKVSKKRI